MSVHSYSHPLKVSRATSATGFRREIWFEDDFYGLDPGLFFDKQCRLLQMRPSPFDVMVEYSKSERQILVGGQFEIVLLRAMCIFNSNGQQKHWVDQEEQAMRSEQATSVGAWRALQQHLVGAWPLFVVCRAFYTAMKLADHGPEEMRFAFENGPSGLVRLGPLEIKEGDLTAAHLLGWVKVSKGIAQVAGHPSDARFLIEHTKRRESSRPYGKAALPKLDGARRLCE